jgi:propanol-preferring alcohol dehydrogenase
VKGVSLDYHQVIVQDYPDPEPGHGEVVVRMRASAICRADLSLYHGLSVFDQAPSGRIIVGHEPSGEVYKIGPGVANVKPGDRVAVYLAVSCGHCEYCNAGWRMLCQEWECLGFDRHGADADYLLVPAENCLPIPDEMSFVAGALSTDAIGTLYQAQRRLNVSGRDTIVIVGVGPMGGGGVLVAKGLGAQVIAVDLLDQRLEQSAELGADYQVNAEKQDALEVIRGLTGGQGALVAIDCSGSPQGQNLALDSVRKLGRVAFVGASNKTEIRPKPQFVRKQLTVIGNWYFNISLYPEIVEFLMKQQVPVERLVSDRFALDEAEIAFTRFDQRQTAGKVVFVWD